MLDWAAVIRLLLHQTPLRTLEYTTPIGYLPC